MQSFTQFKQILNIYTYQNLNLQNQFIKWVKHEIQYIEKRIDYVEKIHPI